MEMKDTRSGFGAGLSELGKSNPNVVALCADLTGSLKMNEFADNQNPYADSKDDNVGGGIKNGKNGKGGKGGKGGKAFPQPFQGY